MIVSLQVSFQSIIIHLSSHFATSILYCLSKALYVHFIYSCIPGNLNGQPAFNCVPCSGTIDPGMYAQYLHVAMRQVKQCRQTMIMNVAEFFLH